MKSLLLTCLLAVSAGLHAFSQVVTAPVPQWVERQTYETEPKINLEEVTQGYAVLLYNEQTHVPKQESYSRTVVKIFDHAGVQSASSITASYDPTYQTLGFHEIVIIRNGKIINKLNPAHFQIIRREPNAENYIYDGTLSATINLSDVRVGDIIDYSYSVKGFNPIHKGAFSRSYALSYGEPIGKIAIDILTDRELNYKTLNTDLKPKIEREGNIIKYEWVNESTDKIEFEDNTPFWKLMYQNLLVSEYKSWGEVVDWGVDVFDVKEPADKDLLAKINDINTTYKTHGEKIAAVLNFVQDEIRYLGLESGLGSYKPFPPNQVFEQRYGDCKDKSLLMATMLNKMEIEAYPVLVNTTLRHTINSLLPTPKNFDHCVVKVIDGAGNEHWYDPTLTYQGGTYDNIFFPGYEFGLVLKEREEELDTIYSFTGNLIEVVDEYQLEEVGSGATLKVTTTYHDSEADYMRSFFKTNGITAIKNQFKSYYGNYYNHVTSLANPTFVDDSIKNKFTVYESYKFDSIWSPMMENKNNLTTQFAPLSIIDIISVPGESHRKTEYALYYPTTRMHNIKVKLSRKWGITHLEKTIDSKGFYYTFNVDYAPKEDLLNIHYYFKNQKSYIAPDEFPGYLNDLKTLDDNLTYLLYIPKSYGAAGKNIAANIHPIIWFGIFMVFIISLGLIGVVIYLVIKRSNRTPKNSAP